MLKRSSVHFPFNEMVFRRRFGTNTQLLPYLFCIRVRKVMWCVLFESAFPRANAFDIGASAEQLFYSLHAGFFLYDFISKFRKQNKNKEVYMFVCTYNYLCKYLLIIITQYIVLNMHRQILYLYKDNFRSKIIFILPCIGYLFLFC